MEARREETENPIDRGGVVDPYPETLGDRPGRRSRSPDRPRAGGGARSPVRSRTGSSVRLDEVRPRPVPALEADASHGRSRQGAANFAITASGFRDVEHAREKPSGVFRILGLGDSFTYGALSPFEKSYLYRLEEALNRRPGTHPRVEIIKAGVSRYFPEPERILLEHYGVPFSPDLILVGFSRTT
jgi:hypothetical protein